MIQTDARVPANADIMCQSAVAGEPASKIHLALAVALDAKLHIEILSPDAVHGFDSPMTFLTVNLFSDVTLVVEENVFGQIVGLLPRCRCPGVIIAVFLQNLRMIGYDVIMAVQAFLHRRQSRVIGPAHIWMAIETLYFLHSGVHPMTERNRLFDPEDHARCAVEVEKIDKSEYKNGCRECQEQSASVGPEKKTVFKAENHQNGRKQRQ
jgi:hypothetical protein